MAEGIGALLVRIGADAGDFFTMVGRTDKELEKLGRKVDKHTKEWLKFGAAAAAAGTAVVAFAKQASDVVDELGKMSQKVGVSVESLSALKHAAALSDVSLDQLGTGLKQLSKFMIENNVQGVSVEEQLLRIAEEFGRTNDGAAKTAAAMKYFGKSGADLIPLLNQGRTGIEEMRKEAERLGLVFSAEAAKKAEEFNDNLTRLQGAVQGLSIELAGPLVEALNKVSKSMLDASKNGGTFFQAIVEGFRNLVTGDDLHKWNVEMDEAANRLGTAQNNVSRLSSIGGWAAAKGLAKAREEVLAAEADIKRLLAIKPVMLGKDPEDVSGMDHPSTARIFAGDPVVPGADDDAKKEAEKREQEIRDILHKVRTDDDARELGQIALQNEERAKLNEEGWRQELEGQDAAREESDRIRRENFFAEKADAERRKALLRERVSATAGALGNLASLMNTSSRKTFEIGKVAAIAEGGVRTALATVEAYEFGMKIGGPWTAAAFAAAAAAAGINYINNIRAQTFGGGGGAPTPAGQGASGVAAPTASTAEGGSGGRRGPDTIIHLHGETFGRKQLRDLLEQINEENRDGGRIVLAGET